MKHHWGSSNMTFNLFNVDAQKKGPFDANPAKTSSMIPVQKKHRNSCIPKRPTCLPSQQDPSMHFVKVSCQWDVSTLWHAQFTHQYCDPSILQTVNINANCHCGQCDLSMQTAHDTNETNLSCQCNSGQHQCEISMSPVRTEKCPLSMKYCQYALLWRKCQHERSIWPTLSVNVNNVNCQCEPIFCWILKISQCEQCEFLKFPRFVLGLILYFAMTRRSYSLRWSTWRAAGAGATATRATRATSYKAERRNKLQRK